jgi:hypothetical protein
VAPSPISSPRANLHKAVAKVSHPKHHHREHISLRDSRIIFGPVGLPLFQDGIFCTNRQVNKAAEDEGYIEAAWALAKIGMAYRDAAYQAGRLRVDQVTLDLISTPVSEMYTRQNRIDLETVTVSPAGLQLLREFNTATIMARTKAAANKEAAVPNGFGDNGGSSEQLLSKRAKQRAAALKKKPENRMFLTNLPKEPQALPPIRQPAGSRPGKVIFPSNRPVPI